MSVLAISAQRGERGRAVNRAVNSRVVRSWTKGTPLSHFSQLQETAIKNSLRPRQ